ncbi:MAG: hypothetical protein HKO69_08050 [Woeseiaceae bacterium]|nr:hypothetical protein [Woeseiaceae bacterium]
MLLIMAGAFLISGCEGDDGAAGPAGVVGAPGQDGAAGADGPAGPQGPPGPGASMTPLESCAVCHDAESFASAPAAHEVSDIGSFADFAVAPDVAVPADLIVSFSATVDGAAATAATFRRAYVSTDGLVRTSLTDEIELDPTLFTNNGDGTYSLRIVDGAARFGGANSRYLVVVLNGLNALEIAAVGDYPGPIPFAGYASNEACVDCHGASGEVGRFAPTNRGGHYSAPMNVDACVVCHRPDNPATPDEDEEPSYMRLYRVVHGIHNSHNFPDGEFVSDRGNAYDVSYPTYMSNCSVCHREDAILPLFGLPALAVANSMPVSGERCFSCHGSMDSWDFTGLEFHLTGIPDPETADCSTDCHNGGFARATVAEFHNYAGEDANGDPIGIVTGRGGPIYNGVDLSVAEGAKFDWAITSMVDDGVNLTFTWQASYNGVGVDPCNATVGVGAPVFHDGGVDENGDPISRLRTYRSYAQGDDFIIGTSTGAPGQPDPRANLDTTNTTCAGNVATTVIPAAAVVAEKARIALGGKPLVESPDSAGLVVAARVPSPTYDWAVGDGAPMARRGIVDTELCLDCHVGSMYQHGGDRVDNVDYCLVCHNSASNEQNVRAGMGVDASEAYDGQVGETYEMKTMLHRIHSAGVEGQPPYVIYRNRGIYAFAPDESLLPNWPGTGDDLPVFGSDGVLQDHNFHSADYPRALNACAACHVEGLPLQPDQTQAMATTVEAGSEVWDDQLDDVLQGATTTACVTCHADAASRGHAYQNSWDPQEFPEGRQTIIDAAK